MKRYRVIVTPDDRVYITNVFHVLEDFENKLR